MTTNQRVTRRQLALISLLVLGNGMMTFPLLANEPLINVIEEVEPLENSTGNSQDIGTLEIDQTQPWQWGINRDNQTYRGNIQYEINPNRLDNSPSADLQTEQQEWQDLHRGDPRNSSGKFSITDF